MKKTNQQLLRLIGWQAYQVITEVMPDLSERTRIIRFERQPRQTTYSLHHGWKTEGSGYAPIITDINLVEIAGLVDDEPVSHIVGWAPELDTVVVAIRKDPK